MPSALIEVPVEKALTGPSRKRWTRSECARLEASGLLDQQHLELVDGELIDKMGKNRPHVNALVLMLVWLQKVFGDTLVNPEAPIDVSPEDNPTNEPQPDIIVLNRDIAHFQSTKPGPQDLHLVVEVSDTTLNFDLTVKAALYARAGIADYWALDVNARRLIVHREPQPDLIVLNRNFTKFRSAKPGPQDLCLVVEVSDTSLNFDLTVKAALYARAGIADYWVLDGNGRRLIVHRDPQSGKYASVLIYNEQESVAPLAAPDAMFKALDAFPE